MNHPLVKSSPVSPPQELAHLFADPPVARNERREDYENLLAAIAAGVKPADAIEWMHALDIADLSWEIRREKSLKLHVIKTAETNVVERLLTPPSKPSADGSPTYFGAFLTDPQARDEARQWASGDPEVRRKVDKILADRGEGAPYILHRALQNSHSEIDAIDKRIATYEQRRMAILRAAELYSENLARRLEAASSEIIDGEFTEAAE
jgi:hypothetical protein